MTKPRRVFGMGAQGTRDHDIDLVGLGRELDRLAFENLAERYPDLASELEASIASGAGPAEVRRFALGRGMPKPWVAWLENAARWLVATWHDENGGG